MKSAHESNFFSVNRTLNVGGTILDLGTPRVMGVLNVTPDSFYDGGRYNSDDEILRQAEKMLTEGATFIDVGAYSSRPGAADVSPNEELKRAVHAITLVIDKFPEAVVSVDTFRSEVAHAAVQEGAAMVNDISSGKLDVNMIETIARLNVPYIAMHMRGNPRTMNDQTDYQNLLIDITNHLREKTRTFREAGIKDIIIDPGFGFSKTIEQNYLLLNNLEYLKILGQPIMVGVSRKSMIWKTLATTPDLALNGTTVLNTIAILKGANVIRVHDVKAAMEVIKLVATTLA